MSFRNFQGGPSIGEGKEVFLPISFLLSYRPFHLIPHLPCAAPQPQPPLPYFYTSACFPYHFNPLPGSPRSSTQFRSTTGPGHGRRSANSCCACLQSSHLGWAPPWRPWAGLQVEWTNLITTEEKGPWGSLYRWGHWGSERRETWPRYHCLWMVRARTRI